MKKLLCLLLAAAMLLSLAACGGSSASAATSAASAASAAASEDAAAPAADTADTAADAAPAEEAAPAEDSAEPETLRVGTMDSTDTFDPCSNSDCGLGLMMVFDTVLQLNYETMEVEPCIATEWNWVDDTTLELTIREGVTFSNGDALEPSDVLYSLSRFVYENNQFDPGFDNIDFDNCTIDGNVLTLKLFEVDANFLTELSNDRWASVVDEDYVTANPDAWWDAPVGSGAYTVVENIDGSHSTYQAREDYWGGKPDAENVIITNYSESTTMIADFQNGDLDIALDVSEDDYLNASDGLYGADVQTQNFKTWDLMAVCLPQYTEAFQDIRVRQAISYAIDTTAMTNAIYGSLGTVADSVLIQGCDFYESIGTHEYDPEQAKSLLKEAGAENLDLKVVIPSTPGNEACANILQAYLKEVGINLTVESYDFATAIPILMANGTDISIFGTGGGTYTAASIYDTIGETSTNGGARVEDAGFNDPIKTGNSTTDTAARQAAYTEAAQWAYDNYWTLPICYAEAVDLYQGNISGVSGLTARAVNLEAVTIG